MSKKKKAGIAVTCVFAAIIIITLAIPDCSTTLPTTEPALITYAELYEQVAHLAKSLRELGIKAGDRVAGFMPNITETVIAMLA